MNQSTRISMVTASFVVIIVLAWWIARPPAHPHLGYVPGDTLLLSMSFKPQKPRTAPDKDIPSYLKNSHFRLLRKDTVDGGIRENITVNIRGM